MSLHFILVSRQWVMQLSKGETECGNGGGTDPVSLLSGQNYFQLLVTGGIYINPELLQFLLGIITRTKWPHKMPWVSPYQKRKHTQENQTPDTSFSSSPRIPCTPAPVPNSFRLFD